MHAKALALALLIAQPGASFAQPLTSPGSPGSVVAVPLQDLPSGDTITERAERLWSGFMDLFGLGLGSGAMARSHAAVAQQQAREDFAWLMDIAGYKLKEIESSVSLFPSLSLTFGQARELTEGDRDYVERMLDRHARRHPGPLAAIQRTIVRGIMDAGEIGGFSVDKVEVDLFPLPKVKFQLSPTDAPLGVEASRIMRAIERLNQRVQAMGTRPPGQGAGQLELPVPGSPPALRPATLSH
jgi:hypothetical protein